MTNNRPAKKAKTFKAKQIKLIHLMKKLNVIYMTTDIVSTKVSLYPIGLNKLIFGLKK